MFWRISIELKIDSIVPHGINQSRYSPVICVYCTKLKNSELLESKTVGVRQFFPYYHIKTCCGTRLKHLLLKHITIAREAILMSSHNICSSENHKRCEGRNKKKI